MKQLSLFFLCGALLSACSTETTVTKYYGYASGDTILKLEATPYQFEIHETAIADFDTIILQLQGSKQQIGCEMNPWMPYSFPFAADSLYKTDESIDIIYMKDNRTVFRTTLHRDADTTEKLSGPTIPFH